MYLFVAYLLSARFFGPSHFAQAHRQRVVTTMFPKNVTYWDPWLLASAEKHQKRTPIVLGMQVIAHDVSFALTVGGQAIGVIELERLHKSRYFDLSLATQKLGASGWSKMMFDSMRMFVVPALRQLCHMAAPHLATPPPDPCDLDYDVAVVVGSGGMFNKYRLQTVINAVNWVYVDHHHAHAAMGWFDSPFYHRAQSAEDLTLVLSYDGHGNDGTLRLFIGRAGNATLLPVGSAKTGHSYGSVYDAAASVVRDLAWGFPYGSQPPCPYEVNPSCQLALAGSFMAFAAIGTVREDWRAGARLFVTRGLWDDVLWPSPYNGLCKLISTHFNGASMLPRGQSHYFMCDGANEEASRQLDRDFAATVQSMFEVSVLADVRSRMSLLGELKPTSLVISGGCALNVKVNSFLARELGLPTHVPPAPGDNGLSLGAAWLAEPPAPGNRSASLHFAGAPLLWSNEPMDVGLIRDIGLRLQATKIDDVMRLAYLLIEGSIVAVARSRAEFGPRALGHRSLLSTAHRSEQKERLNRLKSRRWYRPCAPIVAAEDLDMVFEPGPDLTFGTPYMSFAPPLKKWVSQWLPGIAHIDNTARPQGVRHDDDPWMHSLLVAVRSIMSEQRSPDDPPAVGVLINTSLNPKGKPIASDAEDVMKMFCMPGGDELDYVLLEDSWLFSRSSVVSLGFCDTLKDDVLAEQQLQLASSSDGLPVI